MSLVSSGAGLTGTGTSADSVPNTGSNAPTLTSSSSSSSTSSIISISSPLTNSDTTTTMPVSNTGSPSTSASPSSNSTTALSSSSVQSSSNANSTSTTLGSTLTAPLTTSVQATIMSTDSNGQVHTAVIETETVFSSGSIVPSAAPVNNNSPSSSSNTGQIVGGVIGGVGGLLVILAVLFFVMKRQQRRRDLDDFDGNFDPDRIVRSAVLVSGNRDSMASSDTDGFVYAGGEKAKTKKAARRASRLMDGDGTLPNIPIDGGIRNVSPEMQELMSASTVTSRNNLLDEEGMDDEPHSPYRTPSPYHVSLPLNFTSSEAHGGIGGGMMSPIRTSNSRPPSMAMSISGSATLSGHGHSPTFTPGPGYTQPPSFFGNNTYVPGSPLPVSAYGGYAISPERSPSPGVSSASGPIRYANAPVSRRRFSNGPGALNSDATRDAGAVGTARYFSGSLAIINPDTHGGGPGEGLHLS